MNGQEVINEINTALNEVKEKGHTNITIDSIENLLYELKLNTEVSTFNRNLQIEEFKAKNDRYIALTTDQNSANLEMFKSVISSGQASLKSSMFINGGGAVALLAFISKIWNDTSTMTSINELILAISIFCVGVFLSALASGTTYITQFTYSIGYIKTGHITNFFSSLFVLSSFILFLYASYTASSAFGIHFEEFFK